MTLANAVDPYGTVGRAIHWITAVLVIGLLGMGKLAHIDVEDGGALYVLHGSLGVLVLLLVIARIGWRLLTARPVTPETLSPIERRISKSVHVGFYVLLALLPVSGWLLASAEQGAVSFFNLFSLPSLKIAAGGGGEEFFEELHELLGNALLMLVALHVLAALKHHFIDRDGILRRMIPALRR